MQAMLVFSADGLLSSPWPPVPLSHPHAIFLLFTGQQLNTVASCCKTIKGDRAIQVQTQGAAVRL